MRSPDQPLRIEQQSGDRHGPRFGTLPRSLLLGAAFTALQSFQLATADQPEAPVPFEAVRPGPGPSPVSEAARPSGELLPDLTEVRSWAIPPVRWGGTTTSSYAWSQADADSSSFTETQAVNLHANSYVYQPWFAQVSGNVGLLSGTATQKSAFSNDRSRNSAVTYGGNLNLFPQSRFPFQAYLQTSDSRASASAVSSQYSSTQMGASQTYRPETGTDNYSASADRSIVTSANVRSIVDALRAAFSMAVDRQSVSASARYSKTSGDIAGQGSTLINLNGAHAWRAEEELLSVSSTAALSRNQIGMLSSGSLVQNNTDLMQLGSSVSWTPDEDVPLNINAGGNFLHMNTTTETASIALNNLTAFATANYRFSNNLTGTGGINIAKIVADRTSQLVIGENASLSYSGNPLTLGNYSYNWGAGGGVSNQTISGGESSRSVSTSVQHSLSRVIDLDTAGTLSFSASQSLGVNAGSLTGSTYLLSHTAGTSWRQGLTERTTGALSLTAADTYSSGQYSNHFRSLTTQGNLQSQLSARSALTAGLNFSVSQQVANPQNNQFNFGTQTVSNNGNTTLNGSGNLGYSHRSPFNIPNLMYIATLQFTANHSDMRVVTGDPNALAWQTGTIFQQTADYRMGRLIFRATSSFAKLNGKKNASVFFMMGREFGDF